ncbi:MAG: hypothetical protein BMS9Abin20_1172 [Acidimicrobiia bacterium]|nr:MAG: hypothetical protein BMS9Abin20_1172 [Acidimicrobiia bacterium]
MTPLRAWQRLLAGEPNPGYLCDIGTSTVTGISAFAAPALADRVGFVGHPTLQNVALSAHDVEALGSDFARAGFLFERPAVVGDRVRDEYGVEWLWEGHSLSPLNHPLTAADLVRVARHPRPKWPGLVQFPEPHEGRDSIVIGDAPCAGLLEMSFLLRGRGRMLEDITDTWRVANMLLDWSLETVASGYEHYLTALPRCPEVILYGDDYGYSNSMFISPIEFRQFLVPRLRTLFARIRKTCNGAIAFHSCGAIGPILGDLSDLGVAALNIQADAKGMKLADVRRVTPSTMILHGYCDLAALGNAVETGNKADVALRTRELVESSPAIAAPVDTVDSYPRFLNAARGASFVKALTPDLIDQIEQSSRLIDAIEVPYQRSLSTPPPLLDGSAPESMYVDSHDTG